MSAPLKKTEVNPKVDLEVVATEMIDFPGHLVPEIWSTVFSKLDENDKPAFSKACTEWYGWMKGERTQFLFQEIAPLFLEIFPRDILLNNREYCNTWTKVGDHHAQSHQSYISLTFERREVEKSDIYRLPNCFSTAEEIQVFMADMKNHPGNPFPGRLLYVFWKKPLWGQNNYREECISSFQEYWRNLTLLLQKLGSQFHYAIFHHFHDPEILGIEFDHMFRSCLVLLPNLKALKISGGSGASEDQLIEFYRSGQLLPLEHLETLELEHEDEPLLEALLNSCCVPAKLKRLSIGLQYCYRRPLQLQNFINLEVLNGMFSIEQLESISNLPLRNLQLIIEGGINIGGLFNALASFQQTLTQLYLFTHLQELEHTGRSGLRLNLPNLRTLQITEYTGPFDAFLQLKALTMLTIYKHHPSREHAKEELVQVLGLEDRMLESNIWSLMPSLRKLNFQRRIYQRDI